MRDRVVIFTKVGSDMGGPNRKGLSRRWMLEAVEHSLPYEVSLLVAERPIDEADQGPPGAVAPDVVHGGLRPAITAMDARAFGTGRARLLALLSEDASIVTLSRGGEIVGYSICREFGRGHVIGPIVARSHQETVHLTAVHLKKLAGQFARVDTRERDGVYAEFLQHTGLGIDETVTTMSKRPPLPEP